MPETTTEKEHAVAFTSRNAALARSNVNQATRWRDEAIREGRLAGLSLGKLAKASGLSIAQVQRICDLSKDRSE